MAKGKTSCNPAWPMKWTRMCSCGTARVRLWGRIVVSSIANPKDSSTTPEGPAVENRMCAPVHQTALSLTREQDALFITVDQTYATISENCASRILDTANTSRIIVTTVEASKRVAYFVHYHHGSNPLRIHPELLTEQLRRPKESNVLFIITTDQTYTAISSNYAFRIYGHCGEYI